jgi:putative N-acetyltransferase (TIGR04045 family)
VSTTSSPAPVADPPPRAAGAPPAPDSGAPPAAGASPCRLAAGAADLAAHFAVRREVFVRRQALFADDRDAHDADVATLHVVALADGAVVGTVRLYPLGSGLWKGDRLAVLPGARVHHLGAQLVQFAVASAGARGGTRMVAQVQVANVRFFERLGWSCDGAPGPYCGVMHQPMAIPLAP